MNICVIGAGYVGLVTALGLCELGNNVVCIDIDYEKIIKLNKGLVPIYENELNRILEKNLENKKIKFSNDLKYGVENSEVLFIAVGTPSTDNWDVDMTQVNQVINEICDYIKEYKLIVIKSTVPVGTQENLKYMINSNGISRTKFDIVSNPEFLKEGSALYDFFHGDRIVIGYDSERAKYIISKLYKALNTNIIYTTPRTAELIKYASNAFLATKISYINELANYCTLVGADIETVSYAMGLDKRIAADFLRAGIGFGGSCFPKDTKALVHLGKKVGCSFDVVESAIKVNDKQRVLPLKILKDRFNSLKSKTIAILGLTFKPNTDDLREAPSIYIIDALLENECIVNCYDPIVKNKIKNIYSKVFCFSNMYDCVEGVDAAIICTEWNEILGIDLEKVKNNMKEPIIIDGRNILDLNKVKEYNIEYYSIGRKI